MASTPTHALLGALTARADEFVALRRDIHRHPEMGFQEHRTSELVAERLTQWGYTVTRGLGGTGVVGQLRRGTGVKRLGLRAGVVQMVIDGVILAVAFGMLDPLRVALSLVGAAALNFVTFAMRWSRFSSSVS